MARPKQGTKEGALAINKWRETMEEKNGGVEGLHRKMCEMGKKGGRKGAKDGVIKGFATNATIARLAGALGGRNSHRGPELLKNKSGIHEISLCKHCNCMTKTYRVTGLCAKCGAAKRKGMHRKNR